MTLKPTTVFDSYWHFAAERQALYMRRLCDPHGPWTADPVLSRYRFTNAYRAADRVSQYLIGEVLYRPDRSQSPKEVFFRTLLFKLFNKIETWEYIESEIGSISWQSVDLDAISTALDSAIERGQTIYSAAYIMPPPRLGHDRKHANHLSLLRIMMDDQLPSKIEKAKNLRSVYELLLSYPGLGRFLAYQYTIDLNYSTMIEFDENEFVVAGPGALDGISKCFESFSESDPAEIIFQVTEAQESEFRRRGLTFEGLFGRSLRAIDCQNLFCEISKYARVRHPEVRGVSDRIRIKQTYKQAPRSVPMPAFPPKWGLRVDLPQSPPPRPRAVGEQRLLL